jgi:hypothetical protein
MCHHFKKRFSEGGLMKIIFNKIILSTLVGFTALFGVGTPALYAASAVEYALLVILGNYAATIANSYEPLPEEGIVQDFQDAVIETCAGENVIFSGRYTLKSNDLEDSRILTVHLNGKGVLEGTGETVLVKIHENAKFPSSFSEDLSAGDFIIKLKISLIFTGKRTNETNTITLRSDSEGNIIVDGKSCTIE